MSEILGLKIDAHFDEFLLLRSAALIHSIREKVLRRRAFVLIFKAKSAKREEIKGGGGKKCIPNHM
jgi:hypothetical protein